MMMINLQQQQQKKKRIREILIAQIRKYLIHKKNIENNIFIQFINNDFNLLTNSFFLSFFYF
jgi:hypothetical protein